MATSRLEKIGTIYTRVQGLLRSGAMKWEDRPLFYDIYTAFPPFKECKYMEDPPDINLTQILYPEDNERANQDYTATPAFDMFEDHHRQVKKDETVKPKEPEKFDKEINLKTEDLFKQN